MAEEDSVKNASRVKGAGRVVERLRRTVGVVAATLVVGCILTLASRHLNSPDFWFDEAGQYWLSRGLHHFSAPLSASGGLREFVDYGRVFNSDPGGFTAILALWQWVGGASPAALRALPFVFFLVQIACLHRLALKSTGSRIWPWVVALLPFTQFLLVEYATELRAYSMEAAAVVVLFSLPALLPRGSSIGATMGVAFAIAVLSNSRYSCFLYCAAAGVAWLGVGIFRRKRIDWRIIPLFLPALAGALLSFSVFVLSQGGTDIQPPEYVRKLLLAGQDSSAVVGAMVANLCGGRTWPVGLFFVLFAAYWPLSRRTSSPLREQTLYSFVFVSVSVGLCVSASLAGKLPWVEGTRWSIGYSALVAATGALDVLLLRWLVFHLRPLSRFKWAEALLLVVVTGVLGTIASKQVLRERPRYGSLGSQLATVATRPGAEQLRIFVAKNAAPSVRLACEVGALRNLFGYPARFHFESDEEIQTQASIAADAFDLVVLNDRGDREAYQARLTRAPERAIAFPAPSLMLEFSPAPQESAPRLSQ